jgi:hypothetical protein
MVMDDFGNDIIEFAERINPVAYWRFHWSGKEEFFTMTDNELRNIGLIA